MAIARIDFSATRSPAFAKTVATVVNRVMTEILSIPPTENFIVCQAHDVGMLLHDPEHLPPQRLERIVFIQITLNQGRSDELKEKFFFELTSAIAAETDEQPQNIFINLVEVARSNWSFGKPGA